VRHWERICRYLDVQPYHAVSLPLPTEPPAALTRLPRVRHGLAEVDAEHYGLLKLRAVLRGEHLETTATLSQELHAFADAMGEEDVKLGRDFAEQVREKARMLGKLVPMRSDTALFVVVGTMGGALR
jgi:hypothetical protein